MYHTLTWCFNYFKRIFHFLLRNIYPRLWSRYIENSQLGRLSATSGFTLVTISKGSHWQNTNTLLFLSLTCTRPARQHDYWLLISEYHRRKPRVLTCSLGPSQTRPAVKNMLLWVIIQNTFLPFGSNCQCHWFNKCISCFRLELLYDLENKFLSMK